MEPDLLHDLVKEGAQKFEDIDKAVSYIRRKFDRNSELRDAWVEQLIDSAIREKVHWFRHRVRTILKGTDRGADAIAAISHIATESILDEWPFLDKTLGDATKGELLIEILVEQNQAVGHRRNAIFYEALARKLTNTNMCVREKVSEAVAKQLWQRAATKMALVKSA